MPKSYSDKERQIIIATLRSVAYESMMQKGIKKTTVDELVEKARIPKGTFYLFYKSKESLLFDAIMQKEEELHKDMASKFAEMESEFSVESLADLIFEFFQIGFRIGLLPLMVNGELDLLIRKLPDEIVLQSIAKDDNFFLMLKSLFPKMSKKDIKQYSSAFRALFFTIAYRREIGEYDEALKLLIKGLVMQMWEGNND